MANASHRILMLAASLGSGHLRAAAAVEQALKRLEPACRTEILDIKPLISAPLRFVQFHGYEFLIEHTPWVWRFLYDSSLLKNKRYAAPQFLLQHGNQRLIERLEAFNPDVIVSTQINCHELAYFISPRLPRPPRRISVVTDYDVHPVWSHLPLDFLVVAHSSFTSKLVSLGMSEQIVKPLGIPIDSSFQEAREAAPLRARFQLRAEEPVLLLMGGSVGFGELDRVVKELLKSDRPLQILVVAGKNEIVRRHIERIRDEQEAGTARDSTGRRSTLRVFGYVDFVPELMSVADCFITKPGGLATTEALAKALPMIFVNPIAGHEEKNAAFFVNHGVSRSIRDIDDLLPTLNALFGNDRQKLIEMRRACRQLAKPDAALRLAELILEGEEKPFNAETQRAQR